MRLFWRDLAMYNFHINVTTSNEMPIVVLWKRNLKQWLLLVFFSSKNKSNRLKCIAQELFECHFDFSQYEKKTKKEILVESGQFLLLHCGV